MSTDPSEFVQPIDEPPPREIEAAARAIWEATGHRGSDWIYMAPEMPRRRKYIHFATVALNAAAEHRATL